MPVLRPLVDLWKLIRGRTGSRTPSFSARDFQCCWGGHGEGARVMICPLAAAWRPLEWEILFSEVFSTCG
ncbi:hypothetical protein CP978_34600 [Streptomyces nodosus]|uniref:Uncharacterized protein n=1 Tax=Streptomyces nodosus TaxID=40318 RepID=A0A0B5DMP8_9ACTN|nr:hypothetical protein SNOD_34365 [Streptomyces nodosus]QEV42981.1 hypothetical protein CP978_34600 [Streptomyces nodosus]